MTTTSVTLDPTSLGAGPSINVRWVYSISGLVSEANVSPSAKQTFPPA